MSFILIYPKCPTSLHGFKVERNKNYIAEISDGLLHSLSDSHQGFDYNVIIVKERLQEEGVNEELEEGGGGVDEEEIKYEEITKVEKEEKEQT